VELAQILRILWARKVWLAIVFVVACLAALSTGYQIGLGTFKARSHSYGAAKAQFLVDSPRSSLADLTQNTESLASRAQLYTQYMRSNDVTVEIAQEAGVDPNRIVTEGPYTTAGGTQNIPRPPVVRSNEVRGEPQIYRLVFDAQLGLPIVSIYAQAPTAEEAIKLADASVTGIQRAISKLEAEEFIPQSDRTEIRELGPAVGGTVNPGVDPIIAGLAFIATFILGCGIIVAVVTLKRGFRSLRLEADADVLASRTRSQPPGKPEIRPRNAHRRFRRRSTPASISKGRAKSDRGEALEAAEPQPHDLVIDAIDRLVREGVVDESTAGAWKDTMSEEEPLPTRAS
jgi:hypothetical protein